MNYEIDKFPGREIVINGDSYLYFGGTSYLGMGTNAEFLQIYQKQLHQFGSFYGASRQGNIRLSIFGKFEEYLALWTGSEDALLMSSGYLSGQLCASQFSTPAYRILISPYCHSALWTQNATQFTTFASLSEHLTELLNTANASPIPVIFTDAINFSGDGVDIMASLKELPLNKCILVVDDSHGIGILGEDGSGSFRDFKSLNPKELLISCSLGKALGIGAGGILGKKMRIAAFKNTPLFAGASPPSPAGLATFLKAERLYKEARKDLTAHINFFYTALKHCPYLKLKADLPTAGCSSAGLIEYLRQHNILISDFKYEADRNSLPGRIVLSAAHSKDDVEKLVNIIKEFRE